MSCAVDRQQQAEKYLRAELTDAEQDAFETHILECRECLETIELLQAVQDDLASISQEIQARVRRPQPWFDWRWISAGAILLVALALGLRPHRSHPSQVVTQTKVPTISAPTPITLMKAPDTLDQGAAQVPDATGKAGTGAVEKKSSSKVHKKNGEQEEGPETVPPIVAQTPPTLPANPVGTLEKPVIPKLATDEDANAELTAELFRLGEVQPPPYTFSGVARSSPDWEGPPVQHKRSGSVISTPPEQSQTAAGRDYFRQAMLAYVEKRYTDAASLLEEAAAAEPNAEDSNFYLGVCRLLVAQPKDAISPLMKVVGRPQSSFSQAAHFYLAKAYIQTGDLNDAEEHLRAAEALSGRLSHQAHSILLKLETLHPQQHKPDSKEMPAHPNG